LQVVEVVELEYQDVTQVALLMVAEEELLQVYQLLQDHVIVVAVVEVVMVMVMLAVLVVQESSW
jgi:hypothetical protein